MIYQKYNFEKSFTIGTSYIFRNKQHIQKTTKSLQIFKHKQEVDTIFY